VPFCHLRFSAVRPVERRYERAQIPAATLGAAFRERRWSRALDQRAAADEIGISVATYRGWETNRTRPDLLNMPAAIRFLGFDWRTHDASLGARIRRARTAAGLSLRQLAARLRTDPTTVRGWEIGLHAPTVASRARLDRWLAPASAGTHS
jgi:transcriptional regulator with XRE-family HTH domain